MAYMVEKALTFHLSIEEYGVGQSVSLDTFRRTYGLLSNPALAYISSDSSNAGEKWKTLIDAVSKAHKEGLFPPGFTEMTVLAGICGLKLGKQLLQVNR